MRQKTVESKGICVTKIVRGKITYTYYKAQVRYQNVPITLILTHNLEQAKRIYCAAIMLVKPENKELIYLEPTENDIAYAKKRIDDHLKKAKNGKNPQN